MIWHIMYMLLFKGGKSIFGGKQIESLYAIQHVFCESQEVPWNLKGLILGLVMLAVRQGKKKKNLLADTNQPPWG